MVAPMYSRDSPFIHLIKQLADHYGSFIGIALGFTASLKFWNYEVIVLHL